MKHNYFGLFLLCTGLYLVPFSASAANSEQQVRDYFSDIPVMIEIARCESKFRQYTDSGAVLRGGSGGGMVGVFQFFESIHSAAAKKLSLDLTTLEGNLAYARHLYATEGTIPWNSAKNCWQTATATNVTPSVILSSASSVKITELKKQLALLLQLFELLKKLEGLK